MRRDSLPLHPLAPSWLHRRVPDNCGMVVARAVAATASTAHGLDPPLLKANRSRLRSREMFAHTDGGQANKSPYRLVVRTSRCGRDNPGSTPGEDITLRGYLATMLTQWLHGCGSEA